MTTEQQKNDEINRLLGAFSTRNLTGSDALLRDTAIQMQKTFDEASTRLKQMDKDRAELGNELVTLRTRLNTVLELCLTAQTLEEERLAAEAKLKEEQRQAEQKILADALKNSTEAGSAPATETVVME
jgi:hypothetical protein